MKPVDDGRTRLVVFFFRDPHLLEGGEGGQDGSTDPDRVFTFRGSDNFDFHRRGGKRCDFLLHPVGDTGVHGGTTRLGLVEFEKDYHDNVSVKVFADINITFHDRVVCRLMDTSSFQTEDGGLEERFRSTETKKSIRLKQDYRSLPMVMT